MQTAILIVHILVALGIIGLVLIQHGKGADAGAAFGAGAAGGASGTVFGAKGSSNFLSRSTAILATIFFLTSLSLAFLAQSDRTAESVLQGTPSGETTTVDETPAVPDTSDAPVIPEPGKTTGAPASR
jgi:preprotein translocase subunit SecG